jgi:hypothetical protein
MLKRLWQGWKRIAQKIGNFQARLFLTAFYGVIMLPFGLATRAFADPLRLKQPPTEWLDHPDEAYNLPWAKRQ